MPKTGLQGGVGVIVAPVQIGELSVDLVDKRFLETGLRILETTDYGDVSPLTVPSANSNVARLTEFASGNGYKFQSNHLYMSPSLLPLKGSVLTHDDDGLGPVLNWLIYLKSVENELYGVQAQLITPADILDFYRSGSVFVFNGDLPHAWVCNGECLLLQMTVAPITP